MHKFNVGDKIRRIGVSYPADNIIQGSVYTVKTLSIDKSSLELEELTGIWWSPGGFIVDQDTCPVVQKPISIVYGIPNTSQCDCGGLTTYKTMSPEAHSSWCKSRNNAANG